MHIHVNFILNIFFKRPKIMPKTHIFLKNSLLNSFLNDLNKNTVEYLRLKHVNIWQHLLTYAIFSLWRIGEELSRVFCLKITPDSFMRVMGVSVHFECKNSHHTDIPKF